MSFVAKYFRLLPAVVVVGTGLLALKGVDLARAAQAPASEYGDPDNSGLAPTDNGGAPATRDFASDDAATSGSAAEVDVLSSLTRRRAELDARERALAMRENILTAGEGRVDQKIGALKTLQSQIQTLLAQRDAKQDDQIKALIKSYAEGMPPKKAAVIFDTMPDDVLIPIAKGMKPTDLGGILQMMNPDAAQRLTVKLASLLKLPDPPPSTVCPDPATATPASTDITSPVPSPVVTLNPPLTTAALTNPTVTPLPLPPAPTPAAAPPPAPAPAPAAATPPKPQASTPPKPSVPPTQHPAKPVTTPPAKPTTASATPPVKPTAAAATPPAKPAATPAVTPAPASTPPAKPSTQAAAAPSPASAPPTPLTPHGG